MSQSERNLSLYTQYVCFNNARLWMPVFVLYFSSQLTLPEVLRLEAVYYLAAVLMEVPSGYFSDRKGRKITLLTSAFCEFAAYFLFTLGSSFGLLSLGQIALAASIAFNSGTNSSFHYESLAGSGKKDEFRDREAYLTSLSFKVGALAALAGGGLGLVSLKLPYYLGLLISTGRIITAARFTEPVAQETTNSFRVQLAEVSSSFRNSTLLWCLLFYILMTILNHIPYEFYQLYLKDLGSELNMPSLLSGIHLFLTMMLSAPFAGRSSKVSEKYGVHTVFLCAAALQLLIIGGMGAYKSNIIALLCIARSIPTALMRAPLNALIVPRLDSTLRATYLSVQSLAGRLAFAACLTISAGLLSSYSSNVILLGAGALGTLAMIALYWLRPAEEKETAQGKSKE